MRDDRSRARTRVSELSRIVREHDLPMFRAFGVFLEGGATADAGAAAEGLKTNRVAVAAAATRYEAPTSNRQGRRQAAVSMSTLQLACPMSSFACNAL
jgi:hypothetical protein